MRDTLRMPWRAFRADAPASREGSRRCPRGGQKPPDAAFRPADAALADPEAVGREGGAARANASDPAALPADAELCVDGLAVSFGDAIALEGVSLTVRPGRIVGIVGESGCGKSTMLRAIMGLLDAGARVSQGSVSLGSVALSDRADQELQHLRGRAIAMVFQDPGTSLCPTRKVKYQLFDMMESHGYDDRSEAAARLASIFARLELADAERILESYPFELSGGMSQRVSIALAMMLAPRYLLADEPTSSLDVTVQKQVVSEMMQVRDVFGTGILIVSHNIGLIVHMADEIGVMYSGRLVEFGERDRVLAHPAHPYTQHLFAAVPRLFGERPCAIEGIPPALTSRIEGCRFRARCPLADTRCERAPLPRTGDEAHWTVCARAEAL